MSGKSMRLDFGIDSGIYFVVYDIREELRMSGRPYVICHMVTSIDGRGAGHFLSATGCKNAVNSYYRINRQSRGDAFACGRVTMEESFTHGRLPDLTPFSNAEYAHENYKAEEGAELYAAAFDRHGHLGWETAAIVDDDPGYGNAHIIEILESASSAYLAYLRHVGISYIFASKIGEALTQLNEVFGISRLLLEGGPTLNGAFLREGLIDELSLVVAPIAVEAEAKPVIIGGTFSEFILGRVEELGESVIHMTYIKKGRRAKD